MICHALAGRVFGNWRSVRLHLSHPKRVRIQCFIPSLLCPASARKVGVPASACFQPTLRVMYNVVFVNFQHKITGKTRISCLTSMSFTRLGCSISCRIAISFAKADRSASDSFALFTVFTAYVCKHNQRVKALKLLHLSGRQFC